MSYLLSEEFRTALRKRLRGAIITIEAAAARNEISEFALHRMVLKYDDTLSNSEGRWPEPDAGCIECTAGTVPNDRNTELCPYHHARRVLGI